MVPVIPYYSPQIVKNVDTHTPPPQLSLLQLHWSSNQEASSLHPGSSMTLLKTNVSELS